MQFGFMAEKGTAYAIFSLSAAGELPSMMQRSEDASIAFVNLEKAFDRVPREAFVDLEKAFDKVPQEIDW